MKIILFFVLTLSLSAEYWSDSKIRGRTAPATPYRAVQIHQDLKFDGIMALFPSPSKKQDLIVAELSGVVWQLSEDGSRKRKTI